MYTALLMSDERTGKKAIESMTSFVFWGRSRAEREERGERGEREEREGERGNGKLGNCCCRGQAAAISAVAMRSFSL